MEKIKIQGDSKGDLYITFNDKPIAKVIDEDICQEIFVGKYSNLQLLMKSFEDIESDFKEDVVNYVDYDYIMRRAEDVIREEISDALGNVFSKYYNQLGRK